MSKKVRKLTKKENERKIIYENFCVEMSNNKYIKHELTVGLITANLISIIIMLPFITGIAFVNSMINPIWNINFSVSTSFIFIIIYIILVILHEIIHGLIWGVFAKNHFNSIDFGFIWEMFVPYCTCSEPLKKWQYVLGTLMPTLILGFGLALISIFFKQPLLFLLSELMILSGGGDFFIVLKILLYRTKGINAVYYDHPYECGVVVFEKLTYK